MLALMLASGRLSWQVDTSGLCNLAWLQPQTKCDAGTGENVRHAGKQLTHNSNEPVRQTNSIYALQQSSLGEVKCQS